MLIVLGIERDVNENDIGLRKDQIIERARNYTNVDMNAKIDKYKVHDVWKSMNGTLKPKELVVKKKGLWYITNKGYGIFSAMNDDEKVPIDQNNDDDRQRGIQLSRMHNNNNENDDDTESDDDILILSNNYNHHLVEQAEEKYQNDCDLACKRSMEIHQNDSKKRKRNDSNKKRILEMPAFKKHKNNQIEIDNIDLDTVQIPVNCIKRNNFVNVGGKRYELCVYFDHREQKYGDKTDYYFDHAERARQKGVSCNQKNISLRHGDFVIVLIPTDANEFDDASILMTNFVAERKEASDFKKSVLRSNRGYSQKAGLRKVPRTFPNSSFFFVDTFS